LIRHKELWFVGMPVVRVNNWEEFRRFVKEMVPDTVFYLPEPHPLRKPPLGLRLTFYHGKDMYVFTDFADGKSLKRTGIPLTNPDERVRAEVREEDIRRFLSTELGNVELVSLPPFIY